MIVIAIDSGGIASVRTDERSYLARHFAKYLNAVWWRWLGIERL